MAQLASSHRADLTKKSNRQHQSDQKKKHERKRLIISRIIISIPSADTPYTQ